MEETTVTKKPTNEELINQMYDASLAGQKTQLEQTRDQGLAELEQQQQKLQQQTDANLNRTYVEAAKDQRNYAEIQNAYGLSSGAMAQARLAQDNQLEADLTALRGAQAQVDANIERERTMLSQQYMAAIAQAQADNDLQRAQALYEQAKADEAQLRQNQKEAGNLMASVGDYTILANLYGLTPEQLEKLMPTKNTAGGGTGGGEDVGGFATWEEYLKWLEKGNTPPDDFASTEEERLRQMLEDYAPSGTSPVGGETTPVTPNAVYEYAKGEDTYSDALRVLANGQAAGILNQQQMQVYTEQLKSTFPDWVSGK